MPLLNAHDRDVLLRQVPPTKCPECNRDVTKEYCRVCDVFYSYGHADDCPTTFFTLETNNYHPRHCGPRAVSLEEHGAKYAGESCQWKS
jgi:hypothetical protein